MLKVGNVAVREYYLRPVRVLKGQTGWEQVRRIVAYNLFANRGARAAPEPSLDSLHTLNRNAPYAQQVTRHITSNKLR